MEEITSAFSLPQIFEEWQTKKINWKEVTNNFEFYTIRDIINRWTTYKEQRYVATMIGKSMNVDNIRDITCDNVKAALHVIQMYRCKPGTKARDSMERLVSDTENTYRSRLICDLKSTKEALNYLREELKREREKATNNDSSIKNNEKDNEIKKLKSQVQLLEKRNKELIEENNNLRLPSNEHPLKLLNMVEEKGEMEFLWAFAKDQYDQLRKSFIKGCIPVEEILKWAYEDCGDDHYISYIRNMLQDLESVVLLKPEDYRELIRKYEQQKKARMTMPLIKEVVLNKNVENEIKYVEKGATGVIKGYK